MVIVITDIVKCKSKVLKIRDWIKTNADRITVGVLSFILGIFTTMIYLFITGFLAWYKGK
jgi:hypothetical protein